MGTLKAQSIADKAELGLNDATNVRWTEAELLVWVNAAQRKIAELKPSSYVETANVTMVAGTKQAVPSGYHALLGVTRNMGGGSTPGRGIRFIERDVLDTSHPNWHSATYAASTVRYCVFDEKNPRVFWVYPPQPTGTSQKIEAELGKIPTDLASLSNTIVLDDTWEDAILNYVLYRSFAKDTTSQPNLARSQLFFQQFMAQLGIRTEVGRAYAPEEPDVKMGAQPAPSRVEL